MTDTPKDGETEVAPSNGQAAPVTPPEPPKGDNNERSEAEKLREELARQARANQLANEELKRLQAEKEARERADADRKAKELEEQNKFKDLYEQEKAKRENIEAEREDAERQAELKKAKAEVLAEYSDEVKALVEEAGMDLTDADESTIAQFKEKVDKVSKMVATTSTVGPNNQPQPNGKPELSATDLKLAMKTEKGFHELVTSRFPGIASMTQKPKA